jgi:hypothetical protein
MTGGPERAAHPEDLARLSRPALSLRTVRRAGLGETAQLIIETLGR